MRGSRGLTADELFAQAAAAGVGGFEPDGQREPTTWTAAELVGLQLPPARWAIPGLLPEGVTLLAGAPKVGKSWLSLGLALAVAGGGEALGSVTCQSGQVLYLALEDTPRRLQTRLRQLLGAAAAPSSLTLRTSCLPLDRGGAQEIERWLSTTPEARLVVVDVLARVRPATPTTSSQYGADYEAVALLKRLADRHQVAFLVVHHTRKAAAEDWLDAVSGTHGLAGAADGVLVLRRSRGQADALLSLTGRDVEEAEHPLRFEPESGAWRLLEGEAEDYLLPPGRAAVVRWLREAGPSTPKAAASGLGLSPDNAKQLLRRMAVDGQLITRGDGKYAVTGDTRSNTSPMSPMSPEAGSERETGSGRVTPVVEGVTGVSPEVSPGAVTGVSPSSRSEPPDSLIPHSLSLSPSPGESFGDTGDSGDTPDGSPRNEAVNDL